MSEKRLRRLSNTVDAIVRSRRVHCCIVGITDSIRLRRRDYKAVGYENLVVLADHLRPNQALDFEEGLFNLMASDKRSMFFRKYNPRKRDNSYTRSLGGAHPGDSNTYVLYLAWKDRPEL